MLRFGAGVNSRDGQPAGLSISFPLKQHALCVPETKHLRGVRVIRLSRMNPPVSAQALELTVGVRALRNE